MINKEQLLEFGMMELTGDDAIICAMEKVLSETNEGKVSIAITTFRNTPELVLWLPGGHQVFLGGVTSIEDLKVIERCVTEYEPNY